MMAEVDQAMGLRPQRLRRHEAGSPVGDHGRIERGLVKLVLEKHAPVVGQARVDLAHRFEIPVERAVEVRLAGKVRAVGDPDRQRLRAELLADLDAFDVVRDRLIRAPPSRLWLSEPNL